MTLISDDLPELRSPVTLLADNSAQDPPNERKRTPRDAPYRHRGTCQSPKSSSYGCAAGLESKAPAVQAAVQAEQEVARLRRELQQLVIEEPEFPRRRGPSREGRRGGKAVDTDRLRR